MSDALPASLEHLEALAPQHLTSYRKRRMRGDSVSVRLDRFAPTDQQIVQRLYRALGDLRLLLEQAITTPNTDLQVLCRSIDQIGWPAAIAQARTLGSATRHGDPDDLVEKVIHDLRSGAVQAIAIAIQLLQAGVLANEELPGLFFLTRDQLKIMRNGVRDLDPAGYERDCAQSNHHVRLLVEKWADVEHRIENATAHVVLDCHFDGNISERCLEFSALDRVLYNLINNAVRHTVDGRVYLVMLPQPHEHPSDLRFVIANQVTSEHAAALREHFGDSLSRLFHGGFTTGGLGLGLRICADFVASAYGVASPDRATAEGYIGATLIDTYFVTWFHWPIVPD